MKPTIVAKSSLLTESTWAKLVEVVQALDDLAEAIPDGTVMPGPVADLLYQTGPALESLHEAPVASDSFTA